MGEPLVQFSNQGIAWGEFDNIKVGSFDSTTFNINNYILYYRKISDNQFLSTANIDTNIMNLINETNGFTDFIIYGLYSGSIYIPINSDPNDPTSIYIQQQYYYETPNVLIKNMYLLSNYVYIDREERTKFYQNKHQYVIEQIYFSNPLFLTNINNKNYLEIINPCKYFVFMGQVKYFLNYNVNYLFNYNLYFFDNTLINKVFKNFIYNFTNKPIIKNANYGFNANQINQPDSMSYFSTLNTFLYFPMSKNNSGFGMSSFCLYPNSFQPSGSCNMSYFSSFEIDTEFYPIDIDYNNYVFKCYAVTYNFLKIANGVAAPIFNSNN